MQGRKCTFFLLQRSGARVSLVYLRGKFVLNCPFCSSAATFATTLSTSPEGSFWTCRQLPYNNVRNAGANFPNMSSESGNPQEDENRQQGDREIAGPTRCDHCGINFVDISVNPTYCRICLQLQNVSESNFSSCRYCSRRMEQSTAEERCCSFCEDVYLSTIRRFCANCRRDITHLPSSRRYCFSCRAADLWRQLISMPSPTGTFARRRSNYTHSVHINLLSMLKGLHTLNYKIHRHYDVFSSCCIPPHYSWTFHPQANFRYRSRTFSIQVSYSFISSNFLP